MTTRSTSSITSTPKFLQPLLNNLFSIMLSIQSLCSLSPSPAMPEPPGPPESPKSPQPRVFQILCAHYGQSLEDSTTTMNQIANAPDDLVRAALIALCNKPSNKNKALDYINKMTALKGDAAAVGQKRKRESPVKICIKCEDSFYEEDNGPKACLFHDGDLEMDDTRWTWNDWPYCEVMDTPENREEYPNSYLWSCCEKRGTERGCTSGRHESTIATWEIYRGRSTGKSGGDKV
ncbi:hypothetical protein F4810DRAFT_676138 [Camillea tinctor]|nr:hypothetical protein F4810DRAFT_676138 [Camillea tinctor]